MFPPIGHDTSQVVITPNPFVFLFVFVESVFWALVAACMLDSLQRLAGAQKTLARIKALHEVGDSFTVEERERLIHKIKIRSLGGM